MDSAAFSYLRASVKCCDCECSCLLSDGSSGYWLRSVKRKYEEFEDNKRFSIPGLAELSVARVEIENECAALREMVSNQQQGIQDLYTELEEERNASSSAANEAMSMILRLQREKAEIQMEARQFKRFSEEKMAHDQQELVAFDDLLYKRDQVIQSLTCEVQAYKHRMLSYGLTEAEIQSERREHDPNRSLVEFDPQYEVSMYDYPRLKCDLQETRSHLEDGDGITDTDMYAFEDTPHGRDHLKNLETRIYHIERSLSSDQMESEYLATKNILEKVVGQSPRRPRHSRKFSNDSSSFTGIVKETSTSFLSESPQNIARKDCISQSEEYPSLRKLDNASEAGDDMSDRVYTIDSIHNGTAYNGYSESKAGMGTYEDRITTPRGSLNHGDIGDPDIKKLYTRLHALEADRESMRQAMISMRTDKAQLVLLKEIAQHLYKEMAPERRVIVKKPSLIGTFSFVAVFKWIVSFVFRKKKACRSKYLSGLSSSVGLLMLLDKGPRIGQWRCLRSTQV